MNKKWFPIFLLVLLACIWGSSFILMKRGMIALDGSALFSDKQVASLRMFIASIALFPFFLNSVKKIKSLKVFLFLSVVGVCGNFIPAFLFTYAETEIASAYAGLLNSFTPIFTLILGTLLFRQKLKWNQVFGVLIAFVGVGFLLLFGQPEIQNKAHFLPTLAIILATFLYGISLNTIKHKLSHLKSMEITSLSFGILFLPSLLAVFSNEAFTVIKNHPKAYEGLFFISILSLFGTAFALIIFNRLIALSNTIFASSVTFLIPIVALFIGISVGEKVSWVQILSIFIVIVGILFANYFELLKEKFLKRK
ncbi:MAG: DMT family transporter [Flavobacteriia bacterium]|nr:DMT family transporter [Flavobacteriia bacterium]